MSLAILKKLEQLKTGIVAVVAGGAADNAAASGNPVLIGGKYFATAQTYADGDAATLETDGWGNLKSVGKVRASTPVVYRSAVAAPDVVAVPGTVTCTKLIGVGSMADATYTVNVIAGNAHGRTPLKAGDTTVATSGSDKGVRAAFAQVTGATFYDLYVLVTTPLWVGRVTEAQRASGIVIDAVGHTTAGGTAGAVDMYVVGTGLGAAAQAVNTAYVIPASPVDCSGYSYVDFDLTYSRTDDAVAPSLTVIPFFLNSRTSTYHAGAVQTINFGGASGAYNPNKQRLRVEVRGNSGVALVVAAIAGTGAALDVDACVS